MHNDQQAIADLAYRLWESRGRPQGEHEQIWLDAERQWQREAKANSTPEPVIDKTLQESFPASDPPASRLPDKPPSNAAEKWHAAGIERPGVELSEDKNSNIPEKLARR
jgi:hypothetical protein